MKGTMDAAELTRWIRFAAKGGIGKCTATKDCRGGRRRSHVSQGESHIDDAVTVLMEIPQRTDLYHGYREVGRCERHDVRVHPKLKKPVMTKHSSTPISKASASTTSPSPSFIPTDDHNTSSPRYASFISSPPPMAIVEVPPPLAVLALSSEYQMASGTSSASDLALGTPVHTPLRDGVRRQVLCLTQIMKTAA
ncbi:hypothetical protein FIBSPDRAFT_356910 [Athelia psychrophila]|uniref:Uncharacterized protein n=1 Tax=Athelia psychrophila TaxID=1759441 RepID=A0A166PHN9_9AGAM|nr:hypothetical protein FIBSPDRAFT_356910 [Fibularhizoctonia sp. CBS 109695]